MSDLKYPPGLFRVSVSEIFGALRCELVPRVCRVIPPALFVHRKVENGDVSVETLPLDLRERDEWSRRIGMHVSGPDVLWWASCLELRLVPESPGIGSANPLLQRSLEPPMISTCLVSRNPLSSGEEGGEGAGGEPRGRDETGWLLTPTSYLVVTICSVVEHQVWWGCVRRDESGRITEIETEVPMPALQARQQILSLLGRPSLLPEA